MRAADACAHLLALRAELQLLPAQGEARGQRSELARRAVRQALH
jgi:hypothetical protein